MKTIEAVREKVWLISEAYVSHGVSGGFGNVRGWCKYASGWSGVNSNARPPVTYRIF